MAIVSIKSFSSSTAPDVTAAMEKAEKDDLDAIVLDMRNNGGGLLQVSLCLGLWLFTFTIGVLCNVE